MARTIAGVTGHPDTPRPSGTHTRTPSSQGPGSNPSTRGPHHPAPRLSEGEEEHRLRATGRAGGCRRWSPGQGRLSTAVPSAPGGAAAAGGTARVRGHCCHGWSPTGPLPTLQRDKL